MQMRRVEVPRVEVPLGVEESLVLISTALLPLHGTHPPNQTHGPARGDCWKRPPRRPSWPACFEMRPTW